MMIYIDFMEKTKGREEKWMFERDLRCDGEGVQGSLLFDPSEAALYAGFDFCSLSMCNCLATENNNSMTHSRRISMIMNFTETDLLLY